MAQELNPVLPQVKYWDSLAGNREFTTPYRLEVIESLITRDAFIADLGCGYGRVLKTLWETGFRNLHGIDFSPNMIAHASRDLALEIELRVAPTTETEFDAGVADAVLLYGVLTCITEPHAEIQTVEEARRILKPGGYLFLNDFLLNDSDLSRYQIHEDHFGRYGTFTVDEIGHLKHMSGARLKSLLRGFEIVTFEETPFKTMHGNVGKGAMVTARREV